MDELFLSHGAVAAEDSFELVEVSSHGFFARSDDGFEAEKLALLVLARLGFSYSVLPDSETEKVAAHSFLCCLQSVHYAGLARFQLQAHLFEPV